MYKKFNKRIKKELMKFQNNKIPGISIVLSTNQTNLREFEGFVEGPANTPYHHGLFRVIIHLPKKYPLQPPGNYQILAAFMCLFIYVTFIV